MFFHHHHTHPHRPGWFHKIQPNLPYIIAALLILLAAGAGLIFAYKTGHLNLGNSTATSNSPWPKSSAPSPSSGEGGGEGATTQTRAEASKQSMQDFTSGKMLAYTHPTLGFTFQYPEGYKIGNFPDGEDGEVVLVQKNNIGFQLYMKPFDEDVTLTPERIQKDIPGTVVENPMYIGLDGAKAIVFSSRNDNKEITREIWWVHEKMLYQITTYQEFDELMVKILGTWKWQ